MIGADSEFFHGGGRNSTPATKYLYFYEFTRELSNFFLAPLCKKNLMGARPRFKKKNIKVIFLGDFYLLGNYV